MGIRFKSAEMAYPAAVALPVVLALIFLSGGCASPASRTSAPQAFTLDSRERSEAAAIAHYVQGLINAEEYGNHSTRALKEFARAADAAPGLEPLYLRLADGCLANGVPDKAVRILLEAVSLVPASLELHLKLAASYQLLGKLEEAGAVYIRCIAMAPALTELYLAASNVFYLLLQDESAHRVLAAGVSFSANPEQLITLTYGRGLHFIQKDEIDRAIGCLEFVATHSAARRSRLYSLIGQLHEEAGRSPEAEQHYRRAIEQDIVIPESFIQLARMHIDSDTAVDVLRDGTRRLPQSISLQLALAQVLAHQQKYEASIETYAYIAQLTDSARGIPNDSFFLRYGATCERAGFFERAAEIFKTCLQHYPDAHAVQNYLAYMWAEQGIELHRALDYINLALGHEPNNAAYLDTRGWIYFKQGNYLAALADISTAFNLLPEDATISDHLGDTWSALGNREKAIEHWTASFRADSTNPNVSEKLMANGVNLQKIRQGLAAARGAE